MPGRDGVHHIMTLVADRHGEPEALLLDLTGIEGRLHRQDVIEQRQAEATARREPYAEILGVAVGGSDQPEEQLRLEEGAAILLRCVAALEQLEHLANAGAAVRLVFATGRAG